MCRGGKGGGYVMMQGVHIILQGIFYDMQGICYDVSQREGGHQLDNPSDLGSQ